jgi:predicted phosphodiesterase
MSKQRFLICADSHGNHIHPEMSGAFMKFCKAYKPHIKVHLGDFVDCAALRKGASIEDQQVGMRDDYEAGIRFLKEYRPHMMTLGNHDDRLWQAAEGHHNGVIRSYCEELAEQTERTFTSLNIKTSPYKANAYLELFPNGPKLIHGIKTGINAARAHFALYGSCFFGHGHAPIAYTGMHIEGGGAIGLGCLADMDKLSYADKWGSKLGWRNGFVAGQVSKSGKWIAWHIIHEDGEWLDPTGIL